MKITTLFTLIFTLATFASNSARAENLRYEKLKFVLNYLGANDDANFSEDQKLLDGIQTKKKFKELLRYVDPQGILKHYAKWNDHELTLFLDRDSRKQIDFTLAFRGEGRLPIDSTDLIQPLVKAATQNSSALPLWGLRIALDPGHMGSPFWDHQTGKFVHTADGKHVSEGEIAFHVALLLAKKLTDLGAEIKLTRYDLEAVSKLDYENYDMAPYIASETRASTDNDWFEILLNELPATNPYAYIDNSKEIKRLRSDRKRGEYFISRADLNARADLINEFKPHLTLVLHFDAPGSTPPAHPPKTPDGWPVSTLQQRNHVVRAYVPGNVLPGELASRERRVSVLRTLFDGYRWEESVDLSARLVEGVSAATGIQIKSEDTDEGAIRVRNGVYARNLALNRLIRFGALSYLELNFYDHEPEFNQFAIKSKPGEYGGINFKYSPRLEQYVTGLEQGILNYVAGIRRYVPPKPSVQP